MTAVDELELLHASQADHTLILHLVTSRCSYTCCGRGWQQRAGYEQEYWGYVKQIDAGDFLLVNPGIGAPSYVIACKTTDIELVEVAR